MARDSSDPWQRQRQREEEEEEEKARDIAKGKVSADPTPKLVGGKMTVDATAERLEQWVSQAETMIEQLNNLYQMFIVGVERMPPKEKRKQLDALMNTLMIAHKPTQTWQFKFNNLNSRYVTYRDRWDK